MSVSSVCNRVFRGFFPSGVYSILRHHYRSSTPDILRKNTAGETEPETHSAALGPADTVSVQVRNKQTLLLNHDSVT